MRKSIVVTLAMVCLLIQTGFGFAADDFAKGLSTAFPITDAQTKLGVTVYQKLSIVFFDLAGPIEPDESDSIVLTRMFSDMSFKDHVDALLALRNAYWTGELDGQKVDTDALFNWLNFYAAYVRGPAKQRAIFVEKDVTATASGGSDATGFPQGAANDLSDSASSDPVVLQTQDSNE